MRVEERTGRGSATHCVPSLAVCQLLICTAHWLYQGGGAGQAGSRHHEDD